MADNDETVLGTDGTDTIEVSEGVRFVSGEAGDDTITGGTGRDLMRGGSGGGTIHGNEGNDVIRGDSGDDTIHCGDDNDLILGDTGNDTLYADAGDDFLIGGAGDDSLTGGTGADTFVFEDGGGHDTITEFDTDNDTIDLSLVSEAITFADLTFTALSDGTGTVIMHSALGGSITVLGLDPTDFTADLLNLTDGTAASLEVDERTTMDSWADPMEGSPLSEIIMDGSNATRIVAMEGSDSDLCRRRRRPARGWRGPRPAARRCRQRYPRRLVPATTISGAEAVTTPSCSSRGMETTRSRISPTGKT